MHRTLQYLFGGVASSALIAGVVAAFITITSLVTTTSFPDGNSVKRPPGPHAVRIAAADRRPTAGGPAGPTATTTPAAVSWLASVGRSLNAGTSRPGGSGAGTARTGQGGSSSSGHQGGGTSSPGGGGSAPSSGGDGNGTPTRPAGPTPGTPPPSGGPPPPSGGGGDPTP